MKINLAVIFGGKTTEHDISIISAAQAIENVDRTKYNVIPIYITNENEFYTGNALFNLKEYSNKANLLKKCVKVNWISEPPTDSGENGQVFIQALGKNKLTSKVALCAKKIFSKNDQNAQNLKQNNKDANFQNINNLIISKRLPIDVALPVVHGANVEDGNLQGFFKTLGLPFSGCDTLSSAICLDKYFSKLLLKEAGVPVLDCVLISIDDFEIDATGNKAIKHIEDSVSYPVIVKPVNLGSSIGVKIAKNKQELKEALENAFLFSPKVIVEPAIQDLLEINCGVVGNWHSAVSSLCEEPILSKGEILSFQDKYLGGAKSFDGSKAVGGSKGVNGTKGVNDTKSLNGTKSSSGSKNTSGSMLSLSRKIPAEITVKQTKKIQELAVKAFKFLGCSGVSRIDFIIDNTTGNIWLNEINTIPGSLAYYLWDELTYSQLIDKLVEIALSNKRDEKQFTYSYIGHVL